MKICLKGQVVRPPTMNFKFLQDNINIQKVHNGHEHYQANCLDVE